MFVVALALCLSASLTSCGPSYIDEEDAAKTIELTPEEQETFKKQLNGE